MKASPYLILALVLTACFTLATSIEPRATTWSNRTKSDNVLGMLFGDGLAKRAQVAPMKAGKRPTVTQASKYVSPNDGRKNKQEKQKKAGEQPQPDDNAQGKAQEMAVELVEEIAPAQALVAEPERDTEAVTVAKSNVGDGIR